MGRRKNLTLCLALSFIVAAAYFAAHQFIENRPAPHLHADATQEFSQSRELSTQVAGNRPSPSANLESASERTPRTGFEPNQENASLLRSPTQTSASDADANATAHTQTLSPLIDQAVNSREQAIQIFPKLEACITQSNHASPSGPPKQFGCLLGAHRIAKAYPEEFRSRFEELVYQLPNRLREIFHTIARE
ncbi:MAG: hypothetical protein AB1540_09140 [Bdellovibrionota bacterium]